MGRLGRKGLVFSLLAIALSSLFLLVYSPRWDGINDHSTSLTRVEVINRDIEDFSFYAQSALSVSAFNAFNKLYNQINTTESYLDNFSYRFIDCTIKGQHTPRCRNNKTYFALLDEYITLIEQEHQSEWEYFIYDNVTLDVQRWAVVMDVSILLFVTDSSASWETMIPVHSSVSIIGVYDPSFIFINSNFGGSEYRRFSQDYSPLWNYTSFAKWYGVQSYHASDEGPCISHRFEGDFSAQGGDCGLMSLVNPFFHPSLLSDDTGLTHLDFRLLRGETFECIPDPGDSARVSICDVDQFLTLSTDDALAFNMSSHWCSLNNNTYAFNC